MLSWWNFAWFEVCQSVCCLKNVLESLGQRWLFSRARQMWFNEGGGECNGLDHGPVLLLERMHQILTLKHNHQLLHCMFKLTIITVNGGLMFLEIHQSRNIVMKVNHLLQGHLEKACLWSKKINFILANLNYNKTNHKPNLHSKIWRMEGKFSFSNKPIICSFLLQLKHLQTINLIWFKNHSLILSNVWV